MAYKNYDIWAIQYYPQEIDHAIEGLEKTQDNILYNNLRSFLKVGNQVLPVQFNTAFVSDEEDRLILLMKDGQLTPNQLREKLNEKKVPYNEVSFVKSTTSSEQNLKEIWFAVDKYVVEDALLESKGKGIDTCDYYPDLSGCLELRYLTNQDDCITIHKQLMRGVIVLEDKIVLLMSNMYGRGIEFQQVLETLYEHNMAPNVVIGESGLPAEQLPKQYKKEQ